MATQTDDPSKRDEILVRQTVDLNWKKGITHLKVQNGAALLILNGNVVERINLNTSSSNVTNLPLASEDFVTYIHLDYSGVHSLISSKNGDNFYLNMKSGKLCALKRLRALTVSAVAWNLESASESDTGFVLLGSTKGAFVEMNIINANSSSPTLSHLKHWENVFGADMKTPLPITALYFFPCSDDEDRYVLLVCMFDRLYALCELPNFGAITHSAAAPPVVGTVWSMAMVEQTSGVLQSFFTFSKNQLPRYHCYNSDNNGTFLRDNLIIHPVSLNETPTKFCWVTNEGISHGTLDVGRKKVDKADDSGCTTNTKPSSSDAFEIIKEEMFTKYKQMNNAVEVPIGMAMSEYHVLLLYRDRINAISLFNQRIVFEEFFSDLPESYSNWIPLGLTKDESTQLFWVFSNSFAFNYRPCDETRHIWRFYLDQMEFVKARKLTSALKDPAPYQLVIRREAEKFISEKNYVAAAEILADSNDPFEAVVFQFMKGSAESRNGLKRFLELKLNQMLQPVDAIKRDVLVIWLLEIQLSELAEVKLKNRHQQLKSHQKLKKDGVSLNENNADNISISTEMSFLVQETEVKKLREELYCFLNRKIVNDSINANCAAVYRMISTHVDFETQLHIANKLKDYEVVLKVLLLQRQFNDVLEVLKNQANPAFYYKYAPELIFEIPMELVNALLEHRKILNANRLLPVFYKCFEEGEREDGKGNGDLMKSKVVDATFFYFEEIVAGSGKQNKDVLMDRNVYNFVVHLYAIFKSDLLLDYLKRFGNRQSKLPYDVDFALRICHDKSLYEEAVDLALTINVDLARQCAVEMNETEREDSILDDDFGDIFNEDLFKELVPRKKLSQEQKKHVWLKIGHHIIKNSNVEKNANIEACMRLLNESKGVLKVQDILAYFPDFTSIEHFKEPLCVYLKEHSKKIQTLQNEMHETAEMANKIRGELEKNKSKFTIVKMSYKCTFCKENLLTQPFYAFLCRHLVHKNCVEQHLIQTEFSTEEKELYGKLINEEKALCKHLQVVTNAREYTKLTGNLERVRTQLKQMLTEDCPLCGIRLINSIDKPFLTDDQ